jgi:large subunit ribosomal protein L10
LNKESKQQTVAEMHEKLQRAQAVFLADFRGLSVEKVTALRDELRKAHVEYRVIKNTLLELAARDTANEAIASSLAGPTAVALTYDDPVAAAKILSGYANKEKDRFKLKGGVLSGKAIDVSGVQALAELPSREVLLAKLLGTINAPVANFVGVLAAVPGSFVRVLNAVKEKKAA